MQTTFPRLHHTVQFLVQVVRLCECRWSVSPELVKTTGMCRRVQTQLVVAEMALFSHRCRGATTILRASPCTYEPTDTRTESCTKANEASVSCAVGFIRSLGLQHMVFRETDDAAIKTWKLAVTREKDRIL